MRISGNIEKMLKKKIMPCLKHIKPADFFILILSAAVTIAAGIFAVKHNGGKSQLIIRTPDGEYAYDMSQDRTISVKGAIGTSVIEISSAKARFLESPCPNKTCVQSTPVIRPGDWSACLPNRIFIRVESSRKTDIDAMSQ